MTSLSLLTGTDEEQLRALLLCNPLYNLFMIGNLETMGLGAEGLVYWGQFSPSAKLIAVAMRYNANWCFYFEQDCDLAPLAQLVDAFPNSQAINGRPDLVDPIVSQLQRYSVDELHASYFCRLSIETSLPESTWPTRRATIADVDALAELYATAGIMRRDADSLHDKLARHGRIVVTEDGGRIVSAALTTAETNNAAMIGGVFTPQPLRNRGYASAAMSHLCAELKSEGKQSCLFYDNPAAGAIYRRLGFEDIGPWHLVFLQPNRAKNTV